MYLNRLTLIGFIGAGAETKVGSSEQKFAVFSVATKRSWKNADGGWESRTEWHRCLAFGKLGEFAASLRKGADVQVEENFAAAVTKRTESIIASSSAGLNRS